MVKMKPYTALVCIWLCLGVSPGNAGKSEEDECLELFLNMQELAASVCMGIDERKRSANVLKAIADMHYWGWGSRIEKDYTKAIELYKLAAGEKNLEAAYNLGVIYENGTGISADYEAAVKWYRFAAKRHYRDAQYNLANMYAKGAGIKANQQKATYWYLQAADQGDMASQFNLGNRYARGQGVEVDYIASYKWYSLATRAGDKEAKKMVQIVKSHMTAADIVQGDQMVANWRPVVWE